MTKGKHRAIRQVIDMNRNAAQIGTLQSLSTQIVVAPTECGVVIVLRVTNNLDRIATIS